MTAITLPPAPRLEFVFGDTTVACDPLEVQDWLADVDERHPGQIGRAAHTADLAAQITRQYGVPCDRQQALLFYEIVAPLLAELAAERQKKTSEIAGWRIGTPASQPTSASGATPTNGPGKATSNGSTPSGG